MSSILYDTELWREYAEQMRALSQRVIDPRVRRHTLAAAEGFERIADLASKLRSSSERRRHWGRQPDRRAVYF
jgi:hypothetical protein